MKYKYLLFLLLFIAFPVYANTIDKIDMDVYIDHNGNGYITEKWVATVGEGTEFYHPYFDLGASSITDIKASMDGVEYETIKNWKVSASFENKAYKAGLYKASGNEYDVCAGISEYGTHTYILKYTIKKMVANLTDADMFYWNLFPNNFSPSPKQVNITMSGDFVRDNIVSMYGYGKTNATFYETDNKIYINSNNAVSSHEYLTVLIRFNKDTFEDTNKINKTFEYYYNNSTSDEGEPNVGGSNGQGSYLLINILKSALAIGVLVLIPYFVIKALTNTKVDDHPNYVGGYLKCTFGETGNEVPEEVDYYRNIPNDGDLYRSFWIAGNYGLMEKREDFMGAILLKWLLNGNIKFNEDNDIELLKQPSSNEEELENKLYHFFVGASEKNILKQEGFKMWCKRYPSKMYHWFTDVIDEETVKLTKDGKVKMIKSDDNYHTLSYEVDDKMMEDAKKIAGFKKFLNDFTLMNEKEKIEIKLWEEYLIYAQMFGVAEKISKEFKELYPQLVEIIDESNFRFDDIKKITASSNYIVKITDEAITKSNSSDYRGFNSSSGYLSNSFDSPSRFSGGGGRGSFGGGGGSRGGGGFR